MITLNKSNVSGACAIYYVYFGKTVAIMRDSYNFANYMTKEMEMGPAVAQARSQLDLTYNATVSH